jgi:hypothetical protein
MAQAMGVPPKTENEECAGKTLPIRGSEGGRRGFTGTCQLGITWRVPRQPSARLTHDLELATEMWRLRFSVFGGTLMAFMRLWRIFLCLFQRAKLFRY